MLDDTNGLQANRLIVVDVAKKTIIVNINVGQQIRQLMYDDVSDALFAWSLTSNASVSILSRVDTATGLLQTLLTSNTYGIVLGASIVIDSTIASALDAPSIVPGPSTGLFKNPFDIILFYFDLTWLPQNLFLSM